jgi:hypothetical protein
MKTGIVGYPNSKNKLPGQIPGGGIDARGKFANPEKTGGIDLVR